MSMLTKKEIIVAYRHAKARKIDAENAMNIYDRLFQLRKKMEYLSTKYPDEMWTNCPERKKQPVPLAFCIERCTIKCPDYTFAEKHNPKFIAVVKRLNSAFANLLNQLEKRNT